MQISWLSDRRRPGRTKPEPSRRRWLAPLAVAAVAGLLVAGTAGPAGAGPAQPSVGFSGAAPPYLADPTDPAVTTLAADLGISVPEAQRRIGWQEPAIQLGEQLSRSLGESFGGLWFDEAGDGRVKVGIVRSDWSPAVAAAQNEISRWRLGAVTDLMPVQTSSAQLERDAAWLGSLIATGNQAGGPQLSSATQVDRNRTVLRVPSGASLNSMQQLTVAAATDQLGTRLTVETTPDTGVDPQACAFQSGSLNCDRPLRGGVRTYRGTTAWCTTAFTSRSRSDGKWYIMTAGHCGGVGVEFRAFQPFRTGNFHDIGPVHNRRNAGNDDYAILRINNVSGWAPRNWVFVNASADTSFDPDYTITGTSTSPVGTRVCISGATSLTDCGRVVELNWNGDTGFARARYCSDGGDSGAPIYSGHRARGIHVGVVSGHDDDCLNALYQGVREAARELNVNVFTG